MTNRWWILALIFGVRMTMAFQFQSVAALAPLLRQSYGLSLADIGLLIGLYLSPGIFLAMPSGAIGRLFGDKSMVLLGLALMAVGGLVMSTTEMWSLQLASRLIAGAGGVLLNVMMSKMVTDWFAGKEIATAMAIYVNSWPAGIALALIIFPIIGSGAGIGLALLLTTALIVIGFATFALLYPAPPASGATVAATSTPAASVIGAVMLAGAIWGLYNAALSMVFGFGATMLTERGWSLTAAGSVTSLVLWLTAVSVPLGGILADRSQRPMTVLVGCCVTFGLLLLLAVRTSAVVPMFVTIGMVCGLAAGPIMSLPARVLEPPTRAFGMGLFFTVYYVIAVVAPWLAGEVANAQGSARAAFDLGAVMLGLCCLGVGIFVRIPKAPSIGSPDLAGAQTALTRVPRV